jgi:hypothetical protein
MNDSFHSLNTISCFVPVHLIGYRNNQPRVELLSNKLSEKLILLHLFPLNPFDKVGGGGQGVNPNSSWTGLINTGLQNCSRFTFIFLIWQNNAP